MPLTNNETAKRVKMQERINITKYKTKKYIIRGKGKKNLISGNK
jgi:hypothetical protein